MKKHNFYFIGECAVILSLLLLIGVLIKDDRQTVQGKEMVTSTAENEEGFGTEHVEVEIAEEDAEAKNRVVVGATVREKQKETKRISDETEERVGNSLSDNIQGTQNEEDKIKIAVFGDSIWAESDDEIGITENVEAVLNVKFYNCAIGGTSAAVDDEPTNLREWTSNSFNGMMYIATGRLNADQLIPNDAACEVIKTVNFEEMDYIIVSYGLNDYFLDVPVYPETYYDMTSYVGALRHGISKLQKYYPDAEIILTSPTYCEWFKGERQYELGVYVEAARSVAQEMGTHFLDMYHALGKTPDEKTEYLSDGVHLTEEGMALYARSVIDFFGKLQIQ